MAETIDEITYDYEEDGRLVRRQLDKNVLSKGAWSTIMFLYQELDRAKDEWRAPKIATVQNMAVINQPYRAIKSVNLRAAPGTGAEKVGGFLEGQTFTALGRTDNDWIAVGRKGVTVGYVYAPLVGPVPTTQAKDAPTDLDAISTESASAQGFDLDAIEPSAAVSEQVAVKTTCRTVDYRVKTADGEESKTVDACQSADGAWQLS